LLNGVLDPANGVLHLAGGLVGLAFRLQLLVAGELASGFLKIALGLGYGAFDTILIHDNSFLFRYGDIEDLEIAGRIFNRKSAIFPFLQIRPINGALKFNLMCGDCAGAGAHASADQCARAGAHTGRAADNGAAAGADGAAGKGAAAHGIPATREAKQKHRSRGGHCELAFHETNSWVKMARYTLFRRHRLSTHAFRGAAVNVSTK
jgi:hypothetical protein